MVVVVLLTKCQPLAYNWDKSLDGPLHRRNVVLQDRHSSQRSWRLLDPGLAYAGDMVTERTV